MVDQNSFINTYIDNCINSLIENIKTNLQLQTQIKISEMIIAEKDQIIAGLNQKLTENEIAADWKAKYEAVETNYSVALGKLQHMDTLLAQINDMKSIILEKNKEIESLTKKRSEKTDSTLKVINTNKKIVEPILKKTDDF